MYISPHTQQYLTIKLTTVELHPDCGCVVPGKWVEPNIPSNYWRKEGIYLCLIGCLVSRKYLDKWEQKSIEVLYKKEIAPLHFERRYPNFLYLPELSAVTIIVNPFSVIIAVGDGKGFHILGLKRLLSSLYGHLADHNWSLEVHLYQMIKESR